MFTAGQVLNLGGAHALIRRRVAAGGWLRLSPAVYALRGNPATWLRQVKAAELGHPNAGVSGTAAGTLHGLPGFRPGRIEVTIPTSARYRTELARVRRRDGIRYGTVDGIRTTTVVQTILDLAADRTAADLASVVEHVVLHRRASVDELARCSLDASRRKVRGSGVLRATLDDLLVGTPVPESELERLLRKAIRRAEIATVLYQAAPPWWESGPQRVDARLPVHRVILEADGRAWHARALDFERDHWRDNQAARHGYRVVRLTWQMLTRELPATLDLLRSLVPETAALGELNAG